MPSQIEPTGAELLAALENGVSQWPALEGRFLQVSGLCFSFDPSRPPGGRVVAGSVRVSGRPLELGRRYKGAAGSCYLNG
jgi:5'-nucleotidase